MINNNYIKRPKNIIVSYKNNCEINCVHSYISFYSLNISVVSCVIHLLYEPFWKLADGLMICQSAKWGAALEACHHFSKFQHKAPCLLHATITRNVKCS